MTTELELAINTLMSHLTHEAYVQRWDKGSPAIRALNILQEAVGEPRTAGEKPQDSVDHDVDLINGIRVQRTAYAGDALDRQGILGLALTAAARLEQRAQQVLQAQVYTEYWIDKANSLQEQLNEAHDLGEDLLHRLRNAEEVLIGAGVRPNIAKLVLNTPALTQALKEKP